MKSSAKGIALIAVSGTIAALWSAHQIFGQQRPSLAVIRLYSGADGQTHQGRIEMMLTPSGSYREADASEVIKVKDAQFLRLPKGKVQDWHNTRVRQYIVTLSGRGEVEFASGQKIPLDPGRIVLVEDVRGKGHITRSIGQEDLVFFAVPLAVQ